MKALSDLEASMNRIQALAACPGSPESLKKLAELATQQLDVARKALEAKDDATAESAASRIESLERAAAVLGAATPNSSPWLPYLGMAALGIVFAMLGYFMLAYINGVGYPKLSAVESTRPLLVIAAIISTITFGGALLFGSLFSSEGTFEDRFRHAREIFLAFSGVFGTVMGFYFGAGDTKAAQLALNGHLSSSAVVVHAAGGTPPYSISATYGLGKKVTTLKSEDGWALFELDKTKDCLDGFKIAAVDDKGLQSDKTLELTDEQKKDWSAACATVPAK